MRRRPKVCSLSRQRPLTRADTTALSPFPFLLLAHSLADNRRINGDAKRTIIDAADSGVRIHF